MTEFKVEAQVFLKKEIEVDLITAKVGYDFPIALFESQKTFDGITLLIRFTDFYDDVGEEERAVKVLAGSIQKIFDDKTKPKVTICVKPMIFENWYEF